MVALDPDAEGEDTPLDFAPNPDSITRRLFDEATIEAHLDHLAGSQADDGGWTFQLAGLVAGFRERVARVAHRGRSPHPPCQRSSLSGVASALDENAPRGSSQMPGDS